MAGVATVIGRASRVQGRVTGEGDLEVRGMVRGEIAVGGEVSVDSGGMVDGNVTARRLVVRGAIKGDLIGHDAVVLEDGARVVGDVRSARVAIAAGALLRGLVEADPGDPSRSQDVRTHAVARMPTPREVAPSRIALPLPRRPVTAKVEPAPPTVAAGSQAAATSNESSSRAAASPGSKASHASQGSHAAPASAAMHGGESNNGGRRPPPPVLPSLRRARGQIVKKKER